MAVEDGWIHITPEQLESNSKFVGINAEVQEELQKLRDRVEALESTIANAVGCPA